MIVLEAAGISMPFSPALPSLHGALQGASTTTRGRRRQVGVLSPLRVGRSPGGEDTSRASSLTANDWQ